MWTKPKRPLCDPERHLLQRSPIKNNRKFFSRTGKGGWQNIKKEKAILSPFKVARNMQFQMLLGSCGCKTPSFDFNASWRGCVRSIPCRCRRRRVSGRGSPSQEVQSGPNHAFGHISWCTEDPLAITEGHPHTGFSGGLHPM